MNWWVFGAIVLGIAALGYLLQRLRLIDLSNKRSRVGGSLGGMMGVVDEVFAPTRHEAAVEMDRQTRLPAPAPLAGDGDKGIFNGKVTIDISEKHR